MTAPQKNCYYMCQVCAHPISAAELKSDKLTCDRCGEEQSHLKKKSVEATIAFSLTAMILFIPANLFPFMTIELYGQKQSSTIWSGVVSLVEDGQWPIGLIVFLASLVIPAVKLFILFYISLTARSYKDSRFKTKLYRIVETIGRWSMLDIFLLAVLVAIVKLGSWTSVQPEIGSIFFAGVVIFTMLASAYFDPQLLWKDEKNEQDHI